MKRILIAVDAGHGGHDPGASGNGLVEAEVAAELANVRFAHMARHCGHQVILTRPAGEYVGLAERARVACQADAKLFLSFHINAAASLARGFQVWHHGGDEGSRLIGERIQRMVTDALPMWAGNASRTAADTERYRSGFAVLRGTHEEMPALLLEVGFISNPADAALLRDPMLRQTTCLHLVAAISWAIAHGEL